MVIQPPTYYIYRIEILYVRACGSEECDRKRKKGFFKGSGGLYKRDRRVVFCFFWFFFSFRI